MESPGCTRRSFLRAAGAAAVGVGGISGTAAAAEHADTQPAYVTLSYPEELIKAHQPLLVLSGVDNRPTAYHALYAESADAQLDVIVGFHHYLYQSGVDPAGRDSHLGDREPVYIYLDTETKEPVKVQYSAYHWYSNTAYWQDLQTDETGLRPLMQVVPRWHHYMTYHGQLSGETVGVQNLLESYPQWLTNGLDAEIHPGAVYNPLEEMQEREYWWADGAQNWSERLFASLYLNLGIRGAEQTDLERGLW